MISYEHVLAEIERLVQEAGRTNNEGSKREALAAIRSLAEVALSGGSGRQERAAVHQNVKTQYMPPQTVPVPQVQSLNAFESLPIEEEDGANGKSIFDF